MIAEVLKNGTTHYFIIFLESNKKSTSTAVISYTNEICCFTIGTMILVYFFCRIGLFTDTKSDQKRTINKNKPD